MFLETATQQSAQMPSKLDAPEKEEIQIQAREFGADQTFRGLSERGRLHIMDLSFDLEKIPNVLEELVGEPLEQCIQIPTCVSSTSDPSLPDYELTASIESRPPNDPSAQDSTDVVANSSLTLATVAEGPSEDQSAFAQEAHEATALPPAPGHIEPTLLGFWGSVGFNVKPFRPYLSPRDFLALGQTCRDLRETIFKDFVLGKLIAESSIQCLTLAQNDRAPAREEPEWQVLEPILRREQDVEKCVPNGQIVFEPPHVTEDLPRPPRPYRPTKFRPTKIRIYPSGHFPGPSYHEKELAKPQGKPLLPDEVFHRFEDYRLDGQLNDPIPISIPIYVFYKKENEGVLRLHAASIPLLWFMELIS